MKTFLIKIASAILIVPLLMSHAHVDAATAPTKKIKSQIVIPKISVAAPVKAMGLETGGRMAVPDNYTQVGWYKKSAAPGTKGTAVLGAHVDNGGYVAGVFKNLKDLKAGDDIYVYDGGGNKLHYKVTARAVYNKDMQDTSGVFSRQTKASEINLITCHGKWLKEQNTYESRLVVTAQLQGKLSPRAIAVQ